MKTRTLAAVAAMPFIFVACGKEPEKTQVHSVDSTSIAVVVGTVTSAPYKEWTTFPAELRGLDDALIVTSAAGRVNSISTVGKSVRAGEALCDIESERYRAQYDAAVAQTDFSKGEMDRAKSNVEAGSLGASALQGATAVWLGARSQMLAAKKQWEDSRCQAPFSGVVASRLVERWGNVGPGSPMLRLVRTDRLEAVMAIPEVSAVGLKTGTLARFRSLETGASIDGKVTSVDQAVEPRHRTVTVRIELPNVKGQLRPGMVGKGSVLVKDWKDAVRVPSTALVRKESGVSAMLDKGGVAKEVSVILGSGEGDSVLVREGLAAGDRLVVEGAFRLSEGGRIKP